MVNSIDQFFIPTNIDAVILPINQSIFELLVRKKFCLEGQSELRDRFLKIRYTLYP